MIKSESIANLAIALVKAKQNITNPKKAKANPFFKSKYADLNSVLAACEDALDEQGLAVTQIVDTVSPFGGVSIGSTGDVTPSKGTPVLLTLLVHTSGEFIGGYYPLNPAKDDPQGIGSAITYARRYGLMALLGMGAEDDDGNAASTGSGFVPKGKASPAEQVAAQQAAKGGAK